jgi:transcriptional regulator of heat shock response
MNDRQQNILQYIVEEYISTAQPVSSRAIAGKRKLKTSSATVRNDMAKLEEAQLICQPHTSAGRIPTIAGIQYYIDYQLQPNEMSTAEKNSIKKIFKQAKLRGLAKYAAAYCRGAIIVAQDSSDIYYTGFSYLFSQPEFSNTSMIQSISTAVDNIDSVLPRFFNDTKGADPKIYLGSSNPLGDDCSAIFIARSRQKKRLFGVINPIRTNYPRHIGLLKSISYYL